MKQTKIESSLTLICVWETDGAPLMLAILSNWLDIVDQFNVTILCMIM